MKLSNIRFGQHIRFRLAFDSFNHLFLLPFFVDRYGMFLLLFFIFINPYIWGEGGVQRGWADVGRPVHGGGVELQLRRPRRARRFRYRLGKAHDFLFTPLLSENYGVTKNILSNKMELKTLLKLHIMNMYMKF